VGKSHRIYGTYLFALSSWLVTHWIDPGFGATAEDRSREFGNFDEAEDADHEGHKQRRQDGKGVGESDRPDHSEHRQQHPCEDEDKGTADNLIEAEADECFEPAKK
jgi:hypothetical protein